MDTRFSGRLSVTLLVCASAYALAAPASAAGPDPAAPPAVVRAARAISISGVAWQADNSAIPAARLRLRDVVTGKVAAVAVANEAGRFTFTGIEGGSYLIELVSDTGKILAVGHTFSVAPGESVATFVRLAAKAPWINGFFSNAASAIAATAASAGVTAIAPESRACASPSPGCL